MRTNRWVKNSQFQYKSLQGWDQSFLQNEAIRLALRSWMREVKLVKNKKSCCIQAWKKVVYLTQIIRKYLASKKCLIKTRHKPKSSKSATEKCFAMPSLTARTVLCLSMAPQALAKLTLCREMLSKLFIDEVVQTSTKWEFPAALKRVKITPFQIPSVWIYLVATAKTTHQMATTEEWRSKKNGRPKSLSSFPNNKTVKIKS